MQIDAYTLYMHKYVCIVDTNLIAGVGCFANCIALYRVSVFLFFLPEGGWVGGLGLTLTQCIHMYCIFVCIYQSNTLSKTIHTSHEKWVSNITICLI